MIELDEFAIRLKALIVAHHEIFVLFFDVQHTVQKGGKTVWSQAVRSPLSFHLQNAEVNPHLDDITSVIPFYQSDRQRMWVELPIMQNAV